MTDKEALQEFAKGFVFCIGIVGLFFLFIALLAKSYVDPKEKFIIVDSYQGCDVVRYTDPSSGWNYFLDCRPK